MNSRIRRLPGHYVQVAGRDHHSRDSLGVEVTSGQAWLGVNRQVGHGSADALFSLTAEQYEAALIGDGSLYDFRLECWKGAREDRLMFEPGGDAWRPERWTQQRVRMLPPGVVGEIWHHVDGLDAEADSERRSISAALSGGTAVVEASEDGIRRLTFRLTGGEAYPRPGALITGIGPGSTREAVSHVLGEPNRGADSFALEHDVLELGYGDDGLSQLTLVRPVPLPFPDGALGSVVGAIGEPEEGRAFREVLRLAGDSRRRRWMPSGSHPRRLSVFGSGVEFHTQDATVLGVSTVLGVTRMTEALFPGIHLPPTSADVETMLGPASEARAGIETRGYDECELLISYDGAGGVASELTAVRRGTQVSRSMNRWRSGEFTQFLDVMGLDESHPLVASVREVDGVRVTTRGGAVTSVTIGKDGYLTERFSAFIDSGPPEATLDDWLFGRPNWRGAQDALYDFNPSWIHVHARDGQRISWITVRQDLPHVAMPRE